MRITSTPKASLRFQSSPVPEDGCNPVIHRPAFASLRFQSSPVPEDGCNHHIPVLWNALSLFQSSPVPEDGCNCAGVAWLLHMPSFNPHPSRRTGATAPKGR